MNFIVSANTDIGIAKQTNQDSLSVMVIRTRLGKMVLAVLCDGMGGLEKGEVASATVIQAFRDWAYTELEPLTNGYFDEHILHEQWDRILKRLNVDIMKYASSQGTRMGTTAVVMLLTQDKYYVLNIGDSRAYEITDGIRQMTVDHTFVEREMAAGRMTPQEAEVDSRRNVLLQCVGASEEIYTDMFCGDLSTDAVYMLCSDGFRHELSQDELYDALQPGNMLNEFAMSDVATELIERNKLRQERDNISVVLVRTF